MRLRLPLLLMCLIFASANISAQTDYTSKITNPSFESDWDGWTHKGMSRQGNSVFTLKAGNTYVEKWTGRGGAVGDANLSQVLTDLPPGQYELSAAAQNIQEDTPTKVQTGAWIFAGSKKTNVNVCDTYKVSFSYVHGDIKIGMEAIGATGNYLCVDNFRLTYVGDDLSAELAAAITAAEAVCGDGSGLKADQLRSAIDAAKALSSSATGQQQANAIIAMETASDVYKLANASRENPYNLTDKIENPSFEAGDFSGWTTNMAIQGNNSFSIKQGTYYVEKWTGKGGAIGEAYVTQTIKGMLPGRYILRAAAQNIQEDYPTREQAGAYLVANTHKGAITTRKDHSLEFVLVSDWLTLGLQADNAKGNWVAVDNFRLEYISDDFDDVKTEFNAIISRAEELTPLRMNVKAYDDLTLALTMAKSLADRTTTDGWAVAARKLELAIAAADESQKAFAKLSDAIEAAQAEIDASSAELKEDYQTAINNARSVYNDTNTTNEQALGAVKNLESAAFAFRVDNDSGKAPTVTTDPRYIRGCVWAFGRSTVSGSGVIEKGFCWSENPNPTVLDNRTTEYLNQAGIIYWIRDLKPGRMYYMRAYAISSTYAVGYGEVIKFSTLPKGQITHWYNDGGDEATNDRINNAINTGMDYYWNNLSSIHGVGISVSYSPGTPTADCSYGGSMRVGANSAYQSAGTIMHEALHGIGVGTHGNWWSGDYRSNGGGGDWLGDRVNDAIRFWDNNTDGSLHGDSMHMWPYGCNGAQEDSHSDNLYCMMGILAQALNEDGLPGSGAIGYALPYYSFVHEDGVKYYIKNENESRGRYSAYLVETSTHTLEWHTMTAEQAAADDAAAWYISFTPSNQYYQIKNAKTGYYITYSGSFKTVSRTTPTSAENIHLMRGRVDVNVGDKAFRGYHFIHPESNANPPTLMASTSKKTGTQNFNISNSSTSQRWLILTADEATLFGVNSLKPSIFVNDVEYKDTLTMIVHKGDKVVLSPKHPSGFSNVKYNWSDGSTKKDLTITDIQTTTEMNFTFTSNEGGFELTFKVYVVDKENGYDLAEGNYLIVNHETGDVVTWNGNSFELSGIEQDSEGNVSGSQVFKVSKANSEMPYIYNFYMESEGKYLSTTGKLSTTAGKYYLLNALGTDYCVGKSSSGRFWSIKDGMLNTLSSKELTAFPFVFVPVSEATAIETLEKEEGFDGAWYTVSGMRINGVPTEKGVYIINGKKVLIK